MTHLSFIGNSLAKGTIDSKTVKSHIDHSMLTAAEPVKEFNTSPSDRTNYSGNLRMFQVGEVYELTVLSFKLFSRTLAL